MKNPGLNGIRPSCQCFLMPSCGITSLGGITVTKPDELLDILSEAGSGYHFYGKSAERIIIEKHIY